MKPIHEAWCCQIEVTNACPKRCAHCTRAVRHVRTPYFMSLGDVDRALHSLAGWPRVVGCMGGEPTLHPQFDEICRLYQKHFPRHQCGLWTSGGPGFDKHRQLIRNTFRVLLYNDHSETGKHQPWMIAIDEVVKDERIRDELIDNCWVQKLWSPSINPKGAFFCEIAAVFDLLFDGPGGFDVAPGWWKQGVAAFKSQVDEYCNKCGMSIPYAHIKNDSPYEVVTKQNFEALVLINSPWKDRLHVIDKPITIENIKACLKDYAPWEYLGEDGIRDKKGAIGGGYTTKREHQVLSSV